jgi:hypothetical protein
LAELIPCNRFLGSLKVKKFGLSKLFLEDFLGMVKKMGTALVVFPLIAILECNAVAKAFGKQHGKK